MKKCVVIANSGAGSFSRSRLDSACRQLVAGGLKVEQLDCSDFAVMTATAAEISSSADAPLIVAAGGDGTINAVFSGLGGNSAHCAVIPLGTANVLALELGINSPEDAVQRIIAARFRPLTTGMISNQHKTGRFFLMAGAGFDGAVVRGVTPALKKRFGKGAYLISALRNLASWESETLTITTEERRFTCHSIIVCNAANYGGPFILSPEASLFSPTLELIAVTDNSRRGPMALTAAALFSNSSRSIHRLTASKVVIDGSKPLQVDGDDWGDSPVAISAESNFASIII